MTTEPASPVPPKLLKSVVAEIDRLSAMTCDELNEQNEIGFFELLDMAITLREASKPPESLKHLGNVLYFLAGLHPDDQCQAYRDAMAFFNSACPDRRIVPEPDVLIRLVPQPVFGTGGTPDIEEFIFGQTGEPNKPESFGL